MYIHETSKLDHFVRPWATIAERQSGQVINSSPPADWRVRIRPIWLENGSVIVEKIRNTRMFCEATHICSELEISYLNHHC